MRHECASPFLFPYTHVLRVRLYYCMIIVAWKVHACVVAVVSHGLSITGGLLVWYSRGGLGALLIEWGFLMCA